MNEKIKISGPLLAVSLFCTLQLIATLALGLVILNKISLLEVAVSQAQNAFESRLNDVGEEMETALSQQASLTSDFHYTLQPAPRGKILLTLSANLKSYSSGSAVSFSVTVDDGETFLVQTNISNNALSAAIPLPVCEKIDVGLVITDQQKTLSQALSEITNVSACLTEHLYLTPELMVKQEGETLLLSGSYIVLDSYGSMVDKNLDMIRLEITEDDQTLHTFYFSQDFDASLPEGQSSYMLLFEKIKITAHPSSTVTFALRARDALGYEYYCTAQQLPIDENGVAQPPVLVEDVFHLNY